MHLSYNNFLVLALNEKDTDENFAPNLMHYIKKKIHVSLTVSTQTAHNKFLKKKYLLQSYLLKQLYLVLNLRYPTYVNLNNN